MFRFDIRAITELCAFGRMVTLSLTPFENPASNPVKARLTSPSPSNAKEVVPMLVTTGFAVLALTVLTKVKPHQLCGQIGS